MHCILKNSAIALFFPSLCILPFYSQIIKNKKPETSHRGVPRISVMPMVHAVAKMAY